MRRILKAILFMLLLIVQTQWLTSQKVLKAAEKAFKKKEYVRAIDLYSKALDEVNNRVEKQNIYHFLGKSHYTLNQIEKAIYNYERSLDLGNNDPLFNLDYANALMKKGNYDEARELFNIYLESYPEDEWTKLKVKSCRYASKYNITHPDLKINNEIDLNTPYAEFGLSMVENDLLISTSRISKDSTGIYKLTGQSFSDFYQSVYDTATNAWNIPVKVRGSINTPFNEGTACFDSINNILYFMQCNGINGRRRTCDIYYSVLNKLNGEWSEPKIFEFNNDEYDFGHPALSQNGKTLYFVSNMPGGEGHKDIWKIENKDNAWGEPENLGRRINTPGNEVFPYVYKDSLLFFASDGHPGFGGLDLFYAEFTKRGFGRPENLEKPINSSRDDFSVVAFKIDSGLFCSNRKGGVGGDDIYAFYRKQESMTISGYIKDRKDNQPIQEAYVLLSGSDESVDSTITDNEGAYKFEEVKTGREYALTVHKDGYLKDLQFVPPVSLGDTALKDSSMNFKFDLIEATDEEINIQDIYYDFGKWNLTRESKKELDKMVNLLKVNPEIKIRINSHTDVVGDDEFNMELSVYRAQSVVNYLIEKGIKPERLSYKGWGETSPVLENARTDEEHQKNRRTTFQIVNLDDVDLDYNPGEYKELANRIILKKTEKTQEIRKKQWLKKEVVFRLQIYAGKRRMSRSYRNEIKELIGDYEINMIKGNDGLYRYSVGDFKKFEPAMEMHEKLKEQNYQSFVFALLNGKRITILEARQLTGQNNN